MAIAQGVASADEPADCPALSVSAGNHPERMPRGSKKCVGREFFRGRGPGTMQLETINVVMSLAFLSIWALVGRILVRQHIN